MTSAVSRDRCRASREPLGRWSRPARELGEELGDQAGPQVGLGVVPGVEPHLPHVRRARSGRRGRRGLAARAVTAAETRSRNWLLPSPHCPNTPTASGGCADRDVNRSAIAAASRSRSSRSRAGHPRVRHVCGNPRTRSSRTTSHSRTVPSSLAGGEQGAAGGAGGRASPGRPAAAPPPPPTESVWPVSGSPTGGRWPGPTAAPSGRGCRWRAGCGRRAAGHGTAATATRDRCGRSAGRRPVAGGRVPQPHRLVVAAGGEQGRAGCPGAGQPGSAAAAPPPPTDRAGVAGQRVADRLPVAGSHSRTVPSSLPVASRVRAGWVPGQSGQPGRPAPAPPPAR